MLIYLSECALDTFFSNRKEKHVKQLMCDELTFVDAINCIIMLDVCQHVISLAEPECAMLLFAK